MFDNPVVINEYKFKKMPDNFFRPEDVTKFKGKGTLVIKPTYLNEKARIEQSVNEYKKY